MVRLLSPAADVLKLRSGCTFKPIHWGMAALASRSVCFSNNESINGSTCMRTGLSILSERFFRRRAIHFRVVMKFCSTSSRRSKHFQLITSNRDFCGLGSKCSTFLFRKAEEISSPFSATAKPEVAPET